MIWQQTVPELFSWVTMDSSCIIRDIDDVFNDVSLTFVNGFRDVRIIIAEAMESDANFMDDMEWALFDMIAVSNMSYPEARKQLGLAVRHVEYR